MPTMPTCRPVMRYGLRNLRNSGTNLQEVQVETPPPRALWSPTPVQGPCFSPLASVLCLAIYLYIIYLRIGSRAQRGFGCYRLRAKPFEGPIRAMSKI